MPWLNVPHLRQDDDGWCLPACVAMVAAYWQQPLSAAPVGLSNPTDWLAKKGNQAMDLKQILAAILRAYFFQLLLMAVGILLEVIVIASRDEPRRPAQGPVEKARERIKLWPPEFPPPPLPRLLRRGLAATGFALLALGLAWIGIAQALSPLDFEPTPCPAPTLAPLPVSLVSLSYMVDDYDPRLVDLRRAPSSGIPAGSGRLLQFLDLWVSVPKDAPEYSVHAEIYEDPNLSSLVGVTDFMPLRAGVNRLSDVQATAFKYNPSDPNEKIWRVPSHWTDLYVTLITYREGKPLALSVTKIHLDTDGTAWLVGPPNASFASMVYSVNDGPAQILDLREAVELGLNAAPGDTLALLDMWYHANTGSGDTGMTMQAEAYLTVGGYDPTTLCKSGPALVKKGIQRLALDDVTCAHDQSATSFRWVIPDDRRSLVMSLTRSDRALLDRLILPLSGPAGSAGLVSRAGAVTWPADGVQFLDFERDSDLADWGGNVSRSSDYAFVGNSSLRATLSITEASPQLTFTWWKQNFTADALIAHYYLPSEPEVYVEWLQFCLIRDSSYDCQNISRTQDTWQTVAFDLYHWPEGADPPWNQSDLRLAIQGRVVATGVTEPVTYPLYLDAIQIFEDRQEEDSH